MWDQQLNRREMFPRRGRLVKPCYEKNAILFQPLTKGQLARAQRLHTHSRRKGQRYPWFKKSDQSRADRLEIVRSEPFAWAPSVSNEPRPRVPNTLGEDRAIHVRRVTKDLWLSTYTWSRSELIPAHLVAPVTYNWSRPPTRFRGSSTYTWSPKPIYTYTSTDSWGLVSVDNGDNSSARGSVTSPVIQVVVW